MIFDKILKLFIKNYIIFVPRWHSMIWDGGDWQAINSQWPSSDDSPGGGGRFQWWCACWWCSCWWWWLGRLIVWWFPWWRWSQWWSSCWWWWLGRLICQITSSLWISRNTAPCRLHFINCGAVSFNFKLNLWSWKGTKWGKVVASMENLIFSPKVKILAHHCLLLWWHNITLQTCVPSSKFTVV